VITRRLSIIVFIQILFCCLLWLISCTNTGSLSKTDTNVILIIIDTLRADHLGIYGYNKNTSPNIDKFAQNNTVYNKCYSQSPWTKPSVASIFTSLYPTVTGINKVDNILKDNFHTLAEILKENGYLTAGIVSNALLNSNHGYSQGFDRYIDYTGGNPHFSISSPRVTRLAIDWMEKHKEKKFFLFLHYFDPHYNYLKHPNIDYPKDYEGALKNPMDITKLRMIRKTLSDKDLEYLIALYDGEIQFTDKYIGKLIEAINRLQLMKKTLIILTADHGEEFMTHGWIGHTKTLYDELIHVPLIIHYPDQNGRSERINGVFKLIDIAPTIMHYLNIKLNNIPYQGRALPRDNNHVNSADSFAFSEVSFTPLRVEYKEKTAFKRSIQNISEKLILDLKKSSYEFYNLAQDPTEQNNIFSLDNPHIQKMQELLIKKFSRLYKANDQGQEIDFTERELENLRSLGYIQ
jgi:arylsulfatase A-like enzyme